jgi:hypothetical protein
VPVLLSCLSASQDMLVCMLVSHLPRYVLSLWACSALVQIAVLLGLIAKGNFRKLPLFTAYVSLNICQAGFLVMLYTVWGPSSPISFKLSWYSECVTLFTQALATSEILRIALRTYEGIWGLAWRALVATSSVVILLVALATRSHWAIARWFELNRGFQITFASAVIACLLLVRYYSIVVPTAYKMILGGFCFYSCMEILINTVLQAFLKKSYFAYQSVWQFSTMLSFVLVQLVWVTALRKPLPVEDRKRQRQSEGDYLRLSPEIDDQLRQLNEKLKRLWKLEARPN